MSSSKLTASQARRAYRLMFGFMFVVFVVAYVFNYAVGSASLMLMLAQIASTLVVLLPLYWFAMYAVKRAGMQTGSRQPIDGNKAE